MSTHVAAHHKAEKPAENPEEIEPVVEKPKKVKHLTGEERIDALCTHLEQHGIHVPEEIAAKE